MTRLSFLKNLIENNLTEGNDMEETKAPAGAITLEHLESLIAKKEFFTAGVKTTVCLLTLKNGFEIIGTSACVNAKDYSQEIGARFALQRAFDKLWELEGYYYQKQQACPPESCGEANCCQEKEPSSLIYNNSDPT